MLAVRTGGISCAYRITAKLVNSRRYWLQMLGVNAKGVAAKMVKLQPFWNLANELFIENAVGCFIFPLVAHAPVHNQHPDIGSGEMKSQIRVRIGISPGCGFVTRM
jgi:hypothetical protein